MSAIKIHPTANISAEAEIGDGTAIWHNAQIREGVKIGRGCVVGKDVYIDFDVRLGDNCKLQNGVYLYHPARLGDGVFLGPGVIVTNDKIPRAVNKDLTLKSAEDWQASPVVIEDGASIGAGAVLLPGVHIGQWAMIGSGAVVTRDVPDFGLVVGNPAKLIGYVCKCGHRLQQETDVQFLCQECGEFYIIKENQVDSNR